MKGEYSKFPSPIFYAMLPAEQIKTISHTGRIVCVS